MKIAVIIRGLIRPDAETVINNINLLKETFKNHDTDFFFYTWNNQKYQKIAEEFPEMEIHAMKELDDAQILTYFNGETQTQKRHGHVWKPANSYKMFWQTRLAIINTLDARRGYDYIVITRPDLRIRIDNLEPWFCDDYVMDSAHCHHNDRVGDQFGIGKPDVVFGAWNYKIVEMLNDFYLQTENPEEVLYNIIRSNNITTKALRPELTELYRGY